MTFVLSLTHRLVSPELYYPQELFSTLVIRFLPKNSEVTSSLWRKKTPKQNKQHLFKMCLLLCRTLLRHKKASVRRKAVNSVHNISFTNI